MWSVERGWEVWDGGPAIRTRSPVVGKRLTAVAVLRDVVRDAGNDDAGDTGHGGRPMRRIGGGRK